MAAKTAKKGARKSPKKSTKSSAKKGVPTLGDLLPPSQAKLLTSAAKKLTKKQLETSINKHPHPGLTHKDIASVRKVSITRVNGGQSVLTWSSHNFSDEEVNPQDPSTCSTFS
jgi:hypothetical protein